jgi:hypothetical protein
MTNRINKTYVLTAAQALNSTDPNKGAPNKSLMKGVERYVKDHDAELIILTMRGQTAREIDLHPYFQTRDDIYWPEERNIKLNNNIMVSDMVVPPQNVDPTTGRKRFPQREQSMVIGHTKQRFLTIPTSNYKLPKILASTGAITHPNYSEANHRGDVAGRDHIYGMLVVEIIDNTHYNIRNIRAQKDGKFIDLGMKYNQGRKPTKANVEALVLGDLHIGDHDEKAMKASYEMIDHLNPKRLFLHDVANMHSVNPHERGQLIRGIIESKKGRRSLEEELKLDHKHLCKLAKAMGKREVNIVFSNHDDFLYRYLNDSMFLKDSYENCALGLKLIQHAVEGENPLEAGVKMMGDVPSNIRFLKLDDDYKSWGWQLASHGHKGNSGARGSTVGKELAHGKSITGHSHSPEILRNTIVVGSNTIQSDYTKGGGSSWMPANAVLYEGGLVQLLPIIDGKWMMKR